MRACKTVKKITNDRLISSHARLITTWFVIAIGILLLSVFGPFNRENQVIVAKIIEKSNYYSKSGVIGHKK